MSAIKRWICEKICGKMEKEPKKIIPFKKTINAFMIVFVSILMAFSIRLTFAGLWIFPDFKSAEEMTVLMNGFQQTLMAFFTLMVAAASIFGFIFIKNASIEAAVKEAVKEASVAANERMDLWEKDREQSLIDIRGRLDESERNLIDIRGRLGYEATGSGSSDIPIVPRSSVEEKEGDNDE